MNHICTHFNLCRDAPWRVSTMWSIYPKIAVRRDTTLCSGVCYAMLTHPFQAVLEHGTSNDLLGKLIAIFAEVLGTVHSVIRQLNQDFTVLAVPWVDTDTNTGRDDSQMSF